MVEAEGSASLLPFMWLPGFKWRLLSPAAGLDAAVFFAAACEEVECCGVEGAAPAPQHSPPLVISQTAPMEQYGSAFASAGAAATQGDCGGGASSTPC
jgi:hypothetical protein